MRLAYVKIWQCICSHRSNLRLWFPNRNRRLSSFIVPSATCLSIPTCALVFTCGTLVVYVCVCVIIVPDLPRYKLRMPLLRSPVPELILVPTLSPRERTITRQAETPIGRTKKFFKEGNNCVHKH
jgi:hypothetical protein